MGLAYKFWTSLALCLFLTVGNLSFAGHHWESRRIVESLGNIKTIYENIKTLDDFINASSRLADDDIKGAIAVYGEDKLSEWVDKTDSLASNLKKESNDFQAVEIASFPAVLLISMEARVEHKDITNEELSNWKKIKTKHQERILEHTKAANFGKRCKKEADTKSNYINKLGVVLDTKSGSLVDKALAGMTAIVLWNRLSNLIAAQTQWNEISSNCSRIQKLADSLREKYQSNKSNIDLNIKSFSELIP